MNCETDQSDGVAGAAVRSEIGEMLSFVSDWVALHLTLSTISVTWKMDGDTMLLLVDAALISWRSDKVHLNRASRIIVRIASKQTELGDNGTV